MKKLEELGISQWPWKVAKHKDKESGDEYCNVNSYLSAYVADGTSMPDKHLIASAPELYACLCDAVVEMCHAYCDRSDGKCGKKDGECFVQEWIKTLEETSGESEEE